MCLQEGNQDSGNIMANFLKDDAILRSSNEHSSIETILDPKHKIFLSHSGAQKEFVEHLCKALEDRWHYPFFDRRPESLPKGERFADLIIQAAQQCHMLIVVISNEYFMSKWPMIELNAFVKAHELNHKGKCSQGGPKILPLFYGLSVKELKDEALQKKWFESWEKMANDDAKKRIVVSDWKNALDVLRSFNGLEYNKELKEILAYEDEIVTHVCESISPDLKWDDSHVQGKSRICKGIREKTKSMTVSKEYPMKVVGLHGVGGIGKTTTCKTLSNELLSEYDGRVCHVEFPSVPLKDSIIELLRKALVDLTGRSKEGVKDLDEGMCIRALRASHLHQKVFLAIDNVSDDLKSIEHAKVFLRAPYHKESLVIVTARSKSILENLGIDGDACVEMPELDEVDAMKLFLHHAANGKEYIGVEDEGHILKCIRRCYFSKGNGLGDHYHPLALKTLGLLLGNYYGEHPLEWVKNLPEVGSFGYLSNENPVFDILRSNFDLLPLEERNLFMDVGLFEQIACGITGTICDIIFDQWFTLKCIEISSVEWLCDLHKQDKDIIHKRLENLIRKGLLQDVDLRIGNISVHDLYIEFAKLEAKGSFNESKDLSNRKWVYLYDDDFIELQRTPEGRCWPKLIRLAIESDWGNRSNWEDWGDCEIPASLEGIHWDHFSNVEILHLEGLHGGCGTFNFEPLKCLTHLCLFDIANLVCVEGLGKLKNLTWIYWQNHPELVNTHIVGQLPSSLKTLCIEGQGVRLGTGVLAQCCNLSQLALHSISMVEASTLDLSNCRSLRSMQLVKISKLQTLCPSNYQPSNLQYLVINSCPDLICILGTDHLINLKKLCIGNCDECKVPGLFAIIELLPDLELRLGRRQVQSLVVGSPNSIPRQFQLQEFRFSFDYPVVGLNLDGFNKLEILDLSYSPGLMRLEGMEDLPALRCLTLIDCKQMFQLPDLSNARNLEELDLTGCIALKLREKDIQRLSELPSLQPVPFPRPRGHTNCMVHFAQRKALIHACQKTCWGPSSPRDWKEHEWKEEDLDAVLLQIGKYVLV